MRESSNYESRSRPHSPDPALLDLAGKVGNLDARTTALEHWRAKIDKGRQLELWPRDWLKIGAAIAILAGAIKARWGIDVLSWLGLAK